MNLFMHLANSWSDNPGYEATALAAALASFVEAPDWPASRRVLEAHPGLLSDLAEAMLARAAEAAPADSELRQALLQHIQVLWACREQGIGAAFAALVEDADQPASETADPSALVATLHNFVFAPTAVISRRVLDQHPELLSDEAEFLMAAAEHVVHPDARPYIQAGHELLRRCREIGPDAAYAALRDQQHGRPV